MEAKSIPARRWYYGCTGRENGIKVDLAPAAARERDREGRVRRERENNQYFLRALGAVWQTSAASFPRASFGGAAARSLPEALARQVDGSPPPYLPGAPRRSPPRASAPANQFSRGDVMRVRADVYASFMARPAPAFARWAVAAVLIASALLGRPGPVG